ncbi:hypothetical protein ABJI51_42585 [Amycolatopsis sp. NEAU-NG30]|uniref:Uncharacterized protein n=1 Tax=Amycolatopsis melonis TaxID=3156488 RepID=A0ABV0LWI4_9PSEU
MNTYYGTHPGALKPLLDTVGPAERELVRQFTAAEDAEFGSRSVNRFPIDRNTTGAKDWSGTRIHEQRVEDDYDEAARLLAELVLRYSPSTSEVVVFWGNVVIPSIGIPARLAAENAGLLIDIGDDVWIYAPGSGVLIEYWHSGRITAGEVPKETQRGT